MKHIWTVALTASCLLLTEALQATPHNPHVPASGPVVESRREVWLGPQSLMPAPLPQNADFMEMFTPDAPWKFAAAHMQVFLLNSAFIGHATQEQVNKIVADLNRRRIFIALESGVMNVANTPTPPCGGSGIVEGYATPALAQRISQKIKTAGGSLRYLVMDEPVYHGHFSSAPHACHSSIKTIIDQSVPTLTAYVQEFPDIIIGEVEPTRFPAYAHWQSSLTEWARGVASVMKRPIAFFQLDIPWADNGKRIPGTDTVSKEPGDALELIAYLHQLQEQRLLGKLGIIHDGTADDKTGLEWVRDVQNHLLIMEKQHGLRPDQDIFQSWMTQPGHALPEQLPDTLTHLIVFYERFRLAPRGPLPTDYPL